MKFANPALSIDNQISLLQQRGMVIADVSLARHSLAHISYYRLRAYWLPFETEAAFEGEHRFAPGTRFEDAVALYVFDRRLRLLVLDAVERFEVSLRAQWAHHLAMSYGAHGYLNPQLYSNAAFFNKGLAALEEEFARSKDTFAEHYRAKYADPALPPVWMTAELISLGNLAKWITNLKHRQDRNAIARPFGMDEKTLGSFVHHAAVVRNTCAHHARLWNKRFTVTLILPSTLKASLNPAADRQLYNTLTILGQLMSIIAPQSEWRSRIKTHILQTAAVDPALMGFRPDWTTVPIWANAAMVKKAEAAR